MERKKRKIVNKITYLEVTLKSMRGCKKEKKYGSKRLEIKLEVAMVNA
jgi:hypothetical protein